MKGSNNYFSTNYKINLNGVSTDVSTLSTPTFSIHFYLRNKQAKNKTSILSIVRCGNKRIKICLPIQIHPSQWDKRKERLYLSDSRSAECNRQLSYAHCQIEDLCLSLQDLKKVKTHFLDSFIMAKRQSKKEEINVESILRTAFRSYYGELKAKNEVKDSTIEDRETRLNKLCRIINKEMGVNNSAQFLSNGYEELKNFVIDYYGGYTSGANGMCESFALLLNHIRTKPDFSKYSIEPITHKRFNVQHNFKTNLLDNEIEALENVFLDHPQQNNVRYLFLIEAECGSRNCDLKKVIELVKDLDTNSVKTKAYNETKEGNIAIAINTEKLQFYISKLTEGYKKISCTYANQLLKEIASKANLSRIIETMGNEPLSACISTHFGRHTFVTNMRKKGYSEEEVIKFTGHASKDMIKKIYAHLSLEDHESEAQRIIEKVENKNNQSHNGKDSDSKSNVRFASSVKEAKEILAYLGINTSETNLGELIAMICLKEHKILEKCNHRIGITEIKDVFNTDIPLKDRCKCLSTIIKGLSD